MKCPSCGDIDTRVIDSRSAKEDTEIRRRRHCDSCSNRFTTYERQAERALPVVVKKDGRREPWHREKIMHGLTKACEKRPISIEAIERLADSIAEDASTEDSEIASRLIGEKIMARLHELDEVAYVRFASVYRSFKDIDEFMSELADLIKERKPSLANKGT